MPIYEINGLIPVVDPSSFVHPMATLIGDVIIGPNCYMAPGASMRGDFGRLIIAASS
jgi:phenylacetic acid degradation protein